MNFNWVEGEIIEGVASNYVSVVWEGFLVVDTEDDYTFTVTGNDGFRLTLDQNLVID